MFKIILILSVILSGVTSGDALAEDLGWTNISREIQDSKALLTVNEDTGSVLIGSDGGIFLAGSQPAECRRLFSTGSRSRKINYLAAWPARPGIFYAATDKGLYQSKHNVESWKNIYRGRNRLQDQCHTVVIGPKVILVGTGAGVFSSQDDGRYWHKSQSGPGDYAVFSLDISYGEDQIIYLAAENGIFKSADNGRNWEKIFTVYPQEKPAPEDGHAVAEEARGLKVNFIKTDPGNPSAVYFASTQGVYKSLDQGQSWEKLTEFGLLDKDVKMIYLSRRCEVYGLTSSGIFRYDGQRWTEMTGGLDPGKLNYFTLDNSGNIYVAAEKGTYRSNKEFPVDYKSGSAVEEYLKNEPDIRNIQNAAVRYAEVTQDKITQWRRDASRKAFLPQVNIGLNRNSTDLWHWEGGSTTKTDDDTLRRGRDILDWDVSLTWDLSDLIWSDAQTSIDVRSKLLVELRGDILDQVNKLYYERLRVRSELDNLNIEDRRQRLQKQLKLEELAASLDALTCGYYSEQLRLLNPNQRG